MTERCDDLSKRCVLCRKANDDLVLIDNEPTEGEWEVMTCLQYKPRLYYMLCMSCRFLCFNEGGLGEVVFDRVLKKYANELKPWQDILKENYLKQAQKRVDPFNNVYSFDLSGKSP